MFGVRYNTQHPLCHQAAGSVAHGHLVDAVALGLRWRQTNRLLMDRLQSVLNRDVRLIVINTTVFRHFCTDLRWLRVPAYCA